MEVFALTGIQADTVSFVADYVASITTETVARVVILSPASAAALCSKVDDLPISVSKSASRGVRSTLVAIADASRVRSFLLGSGEVAKAIMKWLSWLDETKLILSAESLAHLNTALAPRVFLASSTVTLADLAVYPLVQAWMRTSSDEDKICLIHLTRWFAHMQSLDGIAQSVMIDIEALTAVLKTPKNKGAEAKVKSKVKSEAKPEAAAENPKKENTERPLDDFSRLNLMVGRIVKVWPHPEAERLWCEEIDCGEDVPRKIASGLREHYTLEQMQGRMVVVLANLKPRPLRGFESHGMVLCASGDKVQLLEPPANAKPGDRVMVEGFDGEPDAVLNSKKNPLDVIAPEMKTDSSEKPVAMFRGIPMMVGEGKVVVASAKDHPIH